VDDILEAWPNQRNHVPTIGDLARAASPPFAEQDLWNIDSRVTPA
jgi:hypothetical protein